MKFNKHALFALAFFAFLWIAGIIFLTPQKTNQSVLKIRVNEAGFFPSQLILKKGTEVIFENIGKEDHWPASNDHPTHTLYPEFDPGRPIGSNERWRFLFNKEGVWGFHDHLNPNFKGTITVTNNQSFSNSQSDGNLFNKLTNYFQETKNGFFKTFFKSQQIVPQNQNADQLYKNLNYLCSKSDFECAAETLRKITAKDGPKVASVILNDLKKDAKIDPGVDDHQLSHQIGRVTAATFGVNSKGFLECPMADFNGGCQHGFFEYALGKSTTTKQAAESICEEISKDHSPKDYFYCYHGVGHGVMMAKAYDLQKSINECNLLSTQTGVNGCLQGVFMEDANAGMRGDAQPGLFSDKDPLLPCSKLDEKYQRECFLNQSGYLVGFFHSDFQKAAYSCLSVTGSGRDGCLQGLGLMVTNPTWQPAFYSTDSNLSFTQKALGLCQKFPKEYLKECMVAGLDNIQNFDDHDIKRAQSFCASFDDSLKNDCFSRVGQNLKNMSINAEQVKSACEQLAINANQELCLKGGI